MCLLFVEQRPNGSMSVKEMKDCLCDAWKRAELSALLIFRKQINFQVTFNISRNAPSVFVHASLIWIQEFCYLGNRRKVSLI